MINTQSVGGRKKMARVLTGTDQGWRGYAARTLPEFLARSASGGGIRAEKTHKLSQHAGRTRDGDILLTRLFFVTASQSSTISTLSMSGMTSLSSGFLAPLSSCEKDGHD